VSGHPWSAWLSRRHGPFVCSSRQQLQQCFHQYQMGNFPPERVDYKNASKIPKK
jgi:hypothetical protein